MSTAIEPVRFLMALGQALATANLYSAEHPSRVKTADAMFNELQLLLEVTAHPRFSFLGDEVIYGRMALRDMKEWSLAPRLSKMGLQWLEFDETATKDDVRGFIEDVAAILASPANVPVDPMLFQRMGIRWGAVGIKDRAAGDGAAGGAAAIGMMFASELEEEAEAVRWITTALDGGHSIPLAEAQAVIRSLSVALHQDRDVLQPLYKLPASSEMNSTHALGVSILTMTFAEYLGLPSREVRAIGVAALLHDIGLARVPAGILDKTDPWTAEEEAEYRRHPEYGAAMLLDREKELSLAALVAYEHHMRPDGAGFPSTRLKREPHHVSRMVRITSSYHARRTSRPHRPAMDGLAVLNYIEWHSGKRYDSGLSVPFVAMMREAEASAKREVPPEQD